MEEGEGFIVEGTFIESVSSSELRILEGARVGVDISGEISFIFSPSDPSFSSCLGLFPSQNLLVLPPGEFMCPGFLDSHTHAPQFPNLGLGTDLQLLDWLTRYTFPTETKFSDVELARRVYNWCVDRTLSEGTTTCFYFATIHLEASLLLAEICGAKGQRAYVGKVNMDRNSPPDYVETTADSVSLTREFLDRFKIVRRKYPLVQPIITPRFAPTCSPELLSRLGEVVRSFDSNDNSNPKEKLFVQTHLSENKEETEWVEQLFGGLKYASVYEKYGLLGPRTILAHSIYLDAEERALLKTRECIISHCPASNFSLRSGICPVKKLISEGIKVTLGTDVSGGTSPSMLDCMRHSITASKVKCIIKEEKEEEEEMSYKEAFYLATLGGAKALGLEAKIGSFKKGKQFDALRIKPEIVNVRKEGGKCNYEEAFQNFLFSGTAQNIKQVYVAGKCVINKGKNNN